MALRDDQLAIFDQFSHLQPPFSFQSQDRDVHTRKIVAKSVVRGFQKAHVGFFDGLSIDPHSLINHPQVIAGNTNHPLQEMLRRIDRIVKHDNIAPRNLLVGHDVISETSSAIAELVH